MTTTFSTTWRRVSRHHRCRVCGSDSWCTFSDDDAVARCKRTESDRPSPGADGDGWLHVLDGATSAPLRRSLPPPRPKLTHDQVEAIAAEAVARLTPARLQWLADDLGVTDQALAELGVGWHETDRGGAYSFPMFDADGRAVGIRLRTIDARKFSVRGGREGVFIAPTNRWRGIGPLTFVEGPTDAAALLPFVDTIGRPSCTGATSTCVELGRDRLCVVFADRDANGAGQLGARSLARALRVVAPDVFVALPPAGKDVREWIVRHGGTAEQLDALIRRFGEPTFRCGPLPEGLTADQAEDLAVREYLEDDLVHATWRELQP